MLIIINRLYIKSKSDINSTICFDISVLTTNHSQWFMGIWKEWPSRLQQLAGRNQLMLKCGILGFRPPTFADIAKELSKTF